MKPATLVCAVVFLAAACSQPETAAPPAASEPATACGSNAHRDYTGKDIDTIQAPSNARIIRPGVPVTDDLRADRLNIIVDVDGVVTALECY